MILPEWVMSARNGLTPFLHPAVLFMTCEGLHEYCEIQSSAVTFSPNTIYGNGRQGQYYRGNGVGQGGERSILNLRSESGEVITIDFGHSRFEGQNKGNGRGDSDGNFDCGDESGSPAPRPPVRRLL